MIGGPLADMLGPPYYMWYSGYTEPPGYIRYSVGIPPVFDWWFFISFKII